MQGKKSSLRLRKKRFITLCLALAMALCYNMPIFAAEYVINPDAETKDEYSDGGQVIRVTVDEDLIGKYVWAGDKLKLIESKAGGFSDDGYFSGYYAVYTFGGDLPEKTIERGYTTETRINEAVEVPVLIKDDDGNDKLVTEGYDDSQVVTRAWKISWLGGQYNNTPTSDSGKIKIYAIELVPADTYTITYNVGGQSQLHDFYIPQEGKELLTDEEVADTFKIDGYIFKGWYDNAEFTGEPVTEISALTDDEYAEANKEELNLDFYAKLERIYTVEGPETYYKGSDEERTFHILDPSKEEKLTPDDLMSVEWDGVELKDDQYEKTAGSIKVTFDPEFLDDQTVGEHTFKAVFIDGAGEAVLNVAEKTAEEEPDDAEKKDETDDGSDDAEETDGTDDAEETDGTDVAEETDDGSDVAEETDGSDAAETGSDDGATDTEEDKAQDASVEEPEDAGNDAGTEGAENTDSSAKTGDNSMLDLAAFLMGISILGIAAVTFARKRRTSDEE